jgi:hypothetical protein
MQGKNPDDYLITRLNGFPIRSMKDGWREIATRAGLPGMIFHDLRRTAARNMLRTGVSASVVMEILGWKSFAMLQRYDIVSEADLAMAADKLDGARDNGHNIGHTGLFDALPGIQNWKPKYKGKKMLVASRKCMRAGVRPGLQIPCVHCSGTLVNAYIIERT